MNPKNVTAFLDELLCIEQERSKTAGFMQNVGMGAQRLGMGAWRTTRGAGENLGRATGAFATPVQSAHTGLGGRIRDFQRAGRLGKAWQIGVLASELKDAFPKTDPTGRQRSRLSRGLRAAGSQLGGLVTYPFGLTGSIVGTTIGGKAGDMVGRILDRIRRYHPPQPSIAQQG